MSVNYDTMTGRFAEYGCKLLTTREEWSEQELHSKSKFRYLAQCGHVRIATFKNVKDYAILCKACIRIRNQQKVYERMKERFNGLGMELVTTCDELIQRNMNYDSEYNVIALCGHERLTTYNTMLISEYKLCKECVTEIYGENKRLDYDEVVRRFTENGLKLLTSREEYDGKRLMVKDKVLYQAKCGHERECVLGRIISLEVWNCEKCAKAGVAPKMREKAKTEHGIASGNYLEYQALCLLRQEVKDHLEVRKLGTGTLADCVVRPLGIEKDEWLQIQLKSTKEKHKSDEYRFDFKKKDYSNMIVLCICVEDKRYFAFHGSDVNGKATYHVSLRKK